MLDRQATISWLVSHGVQMIGASRSFCTGYVFTGETVGLQGILGTKELSPPLLIIHEIPEEQRIRDPYEGGGGRKARPAGGKVFPPGS